MLWKKTVLITAKSALTMGLLSDLLAGRSLIRALPETIIVRGGQTEVHNPDPETLDMDTVSKVSKILKEEQDRILGGRWDIWCKIVLFLLYDPCLLFF